MVCVYCNGQTRVTNSRHQKSTNTVWRRRRCDACGALFSSEERSIYEKTFMVGDGISHIVPFERDKLFLSIFDACRHRTSAVSDASALTEHILNRIIRERGKSDAIARKDIISITNEVLGRFDKAAQVHYAAFHSTK